MHLETTSGTSRLVPSPIARIHPRNPRRLPALHFLLESTPCVLSKPHRWECWTVHSEFFTKNSDIGSHTRTSMHCVRWVVAPASRRRFCAVCRSEKSPARRRRHEIPASFGKSNGFRPADQDRHEKSGLVPSSSWLGLNL